MKNDSIRRDPRKKGKEKNSLGNKSNEGDEWKRVRDNIEKSWSCAEETKRGPRDNKKGEGGVSADALLVKPGDSLVI